MMAVVVQNLLLPENVPGFYNDDVQQLDISTLAQSFSVDARCFPGFT
jgi:hypothetical protein